VIRCAVVGASGYTGAELVAILLRHPDVEIAGLYGSGGRAERVFSDLHPRFRGECDLPILESQPGTLAEADAVFLCTPHEASASIGAGVLDAGDAVVLDLSAAFRLPDASLYERFYKFTHPRPELLRDAVYGLVERHRAEIASASLIAVPGCYPTSVILPLAPLVEAGAVRDGSRVIADCISGVSGAGRPASDRNAFCEVSVQPYGVWQHRHGPEIAAHARTPVVFTPHLGPYDRGIVSTIHVELAEGWTGERARDAIETEYGSESFVRVLPDGQWPSVNGVRGTNCCDIGLAADESGHLIMVSAIDNLIKGASGQAAQCMNVRFGLPEHTGIAGHGIAGDGIAGHGVTAQTGTTT
jgi:N-acetyl-gamma-glutamyl-phosphate reductase